MSQLDELRQILVGDNSEQLSDLKARIEDLDARTRDVAEVLAPAIDHGIKESDDLLNALKEPVSEGLKQAIRAEPVEYAQILYPAIVPSIRLAISQAISSLLVTINQTVASATTVSGLRARYESVRTGVPYAELVLRKSLLFRVEHLYLIDRDSGLLIAECAADSGNALDSDAVSAMFAAIQSFVQDSFSGAESDRLTDFKVGPHTVWIAHGPKAMLACVILGDAPESLKTQLYDSLDHIRTAYALQLANFDGDAAGFGGVEQEMEPLLQMRLKESADGEAKTAAHTATRLPSTILLLVLFSLALYALVQWFDKRTRLATAQHYLSVTPGMVVTSSYWQDQEMVIEGLKDPDAILPMAILNAHKIEIDDLSIRTTPFRSLQPEMELQRFNADLLPPQGVKLSADSGTMRMTGQAPIKWLLANDNRLRQLAADKRLNISGLRASEDSVNQYLDTHLDAGRVELRQAMAEMLAAQPWGQVLPTDLMWISPAAQAMNMEPRIPTVDQP